MKDMPDFETFAAAARLVFGGCVRVGEGAYLIELERGRWARFSGQEMLSLIELVLDAHSATAPDPQM